MPETFTFEEATQPKTFGFEEAKQFSFEEAQPTESEILSRPAEPAFVTDSGRRADQPIIEPSTTPIDGGVKSLVRGKEQWFPTKQAASDYLEHQLRSAEQDVTQLEGPLLHLPRIHADEKDSTLKATLQAIPNVVAATAEAFSTPENINLMASMRGAPLAIRRAVAAGFSALMASHTPELIRGISEAETTQGKIEGGLNLLVNTGLAAAGAKEAINPKVIAPKAELETKAAIVGPETAKAIEEVPAESPQKLSPLSEPTGTQTETPVTPVTPEIKTSVESPGPGAASPAEFSERKALEFSDELLPDFLEREKEREIFSEPFAFGKIPILGRLLDPNAKVKNYEQQGLAAYNAARHGVGPAQASYIGSRFGTEIRDAFKADENGDLNVGATEGQSRKISDVFEALQEDPNSYELNPEQQRVWNEVLQPILESKNKLVKKYDLALTEDANGDTIGHFHRIVTDFPEGKEPLTKRIGQMVGAKIPSQRGRVFRRSEAEGWEKGYKYELDPVKRLVSDIERTYKAVADKRLIEDPVFGGVGPKQFESQLREVFSEELASGEITEKSFANILENKMAQGRVYQPGFSGTIFEPETARLLNDALSSGDSQLRRTIATVNDFAKALRLGFDLGVGQLQLLPTFFRNPGVWAKANWESLKAIVKPDSFSEYVTAHEQAVRELAQAGSSTGQLQEFLSGVRPGQAITKVPVVGKVASAFGRQFQTALDVAKIQLWEAWREVTPADQRLSVIRTIESQLNMGRMESIGVSGRQALTERVALLAPSYYRGAVNFVAALAEKGVSGKIARQGMTAFVGGGLALYYGIGKMLGMDDDELLKRLDPSRPEFLQWTTEGSNGRKINFGIGGIHRSLLRLAGNIVRTSVQHPENWKSLSTDKNPISRWLRGHSAVVPELAFTAFSGRDFMGDQADIGTITGSALPLTVQQLFRKPGDPPVTVKELATSFLGLNAYPESVQKQFVRERDQIADKRFGKDFEKLPLKEQLSIVRELNKKAPFNEKTPASAKQIQRAFENSVQRTKAITQALPETVQEALKTTGTHITGYEPSVTVGRDKLILTEHQQQRYAELITEEYNRVLAKYNFKALERFDVEQRQKLLNRVMEPAKTRARLRLIREMK